MHRKPFRAIVCVFLAVLMLLIPVSADNEATGVVTATALRLRAEATTSSKVLATASQGAAVILHNEEPFNSDGGLWFKVTFSGLTGYMSADYIDITETSSAEVSSVTESATQITYGTVSGSAVNLRKDPNTACTILKTLDKGTVVTVTDTLDGWYAVTYQSISGYMSSEYVSLSSDKPAALSPGKSTTPSPSAGTHSSDVEAMAAYGSGYGTKTTNTATDRLVAAAALDGANPSEKQREIVETAMTYLGCSYVYGASNGKTFDCGGFTSWVYRECGLPINRTAVNQYLYNGTKVTNKSDLQPGDLILFKDTNVSSNIVTHVGMYVGQGKFIHSGSGSSGSGRCVKINDLSTGYYARVYYSAKHVTD